MRELLEDAPRAGVAIGAARYSVFGNYVVVYKIDDAAKRVEVLLVSEGHHQWRRLIEERK